MKKQELENYYFGVTLKGVVHLSMTAACSLF
jgi:hypothetical protein